jgi:hypothetical protein
MQAPRQLSPRWAVLSFAALCVPRLASACPSCETALRVRASIFDERFGVHLLYVLLPFLVMLVVSVALYRVGRAHVDAGDER